MPPSSESSLHWNTFPVIPGVYTCEAFRHILSAVPATTFQLIWERNDENLAQSIVHHAYFTCAECAALMLESWEKTNP